MVGQDAAVHPNTGDVEFAQAIHREGLDILLHRDTEGGGCDPGMRQIEQKLTIGINNDL